MKLLLKAGQVNANQSAITPESQTTPSLTVERGGEVGAEGDPDKANGNDDSRLFPVDLNRARGDGMTPIQVAAKRCNPEIIQLLLETGRVDPDDSGAQGKTPLFLALEMSHDKHLQVVEMLLATGRVDPSKPGPDGKTPLSLAKKRGYGKVLEYWLLRGRTS